MTDDTTSEPQTTTGLTAGAWMRGIVKTTRPRLVHSHQYDDEPPIQTDANGNLYPYMCRACEIETGDPYAWTTT